jgi:hypothetical protein
MLTGDCASDALLPEHAISNIANSNPNLPRARRIVVRDRPLQPCLREDSVRCDEPSTPIAKIGGHPGNISVIG